MDVVEDREGRRDGRHDEQLVTRHAGQIVGAGERDDLHVGEVEGVVGRVLDVAVVEGVLFYHRRQRGRGEVDVHGLRSAGWAGDRVRAGDELLGGGRHGRQRAVQSVDEAVRHGVRVGIDRGLTGRIARLSVPARLALAQGGLQQQGHLYVGGVVSVLHRRIHGELGWRTDVNGRWVLFDYADGDVRIGAAVSVGHGVGVFLPH